MYADEEGRTLDEAEGVDDFPEFPVPIPETHSDGPARGRDLLDEEGRRSKQVLLENDRIPAAIVRPCAIYGRGDRMAREWHFVKRALDRRPYVVLANRGVGHFHTTASENIGELVRLVAASPRTDAFNCGDPDPPQLLQIARTIGDVAGQRYRRSCSPISATSARRRGRCRSRCSSTWRRRSASSATRPR